MKNTLLLLSMMLTMGMMYAQSYTVEMEEMTITSTPDDNTFFYNDIEVYNATNEVLTVNWERSIISMTDGWETSVCDKFVCHPPAVGNDDLWFPAAGWNMVNIHFYPNNIEGSGQVDIRLFDAADPTDERVLHFYGTTNSTGVDEVFDAQFTLFPSPVSQTLQVTTTQTIVKNTHYELYDLSGKMLQFDAIEAGSSSFKMNVSDFPQGVYFLKIERADGATIMRKFLKQ